MAAYSSERGAAITISVLYRTVLWYKWKRMLHGQKMLGLIFDVSLPKRVMRSVWFHLKKPKSIWK